MTSHVDDGERLASRRRAVTIGAALGALLAASVIGLTAAALYLRLFNKAEYSLASSPAVAYALALAEQSTRTIESSDDAVKIQSRVRALLREDSTLRLAAVVTEPRSVKYRFLRHRRFLAHSDGRRNGSALDAGVPADKTIYDLANTVRRNGAQIRAVSQPGSPLMIEAAMPIRLRGEHQAMALVVTAPRSTPAPLPAWPIAAGVAFFTLLGALAGGVLRRQRARYGVVIAGCVALAFGYHLLLDRTRDGYATALRVLLDELAGRLALVPAALRESVDPIPLAGTWLILLALVVALIVALLGFFGVGARISSAFRQHRFAYVYIVPSALAMLFLVFVPFGYGLGLGFFDHAHGRYTFVGLANFVEILSGGGRPITHPLNFYFTLGVTVLWTASNVLLHTAIGLGLALLLKDPLLRFKGVYRVLLILPWAVPNYITALIWKGMFHHQYGAVNHVLSLLGLEKVSWFSSFSTAFTANLVTNTWLGFPFMMVVALGALQSIPQDVYEAAAVDGASRWQTFRRITLPLLRPALFPAIVLGSIWTFNMFNIIYLVSGGEPGGASDILITEAYRWAFERADRYGFAAAYALIIFVILFAYTLVSNRLTRATEDVLE